MYKSESHLGGVVLVRAVATAFCLALAACGGGGGGEAGTTPATTPTPQPTPMSAAAVELAAGVATSSVISVGVLASQTSLSGAGSGSGSAAGGQAVSLRVATMVASAALSAGASPAEGEGSAAAVSACPRGGTIDGTCTSNGVTTTVSATLFNCGLPEPGTSNTITASGGLLAGVGVADACGTMVGPTVAFGAELTNFSGTRTDPSGTVLERFAANLSQTVTPTGTGCAGPNGTQLLDGTLSDQTDGGAVDLTLVARNLTLEMTSTGTPCAQQITATGGLEVTDHGASRHFSETLMGTRATLTDEGHNALTTTLDGSLSVDCLGDVQFQTLTPLQFPGASECPSDGVLALTRADETNGRINFTTGGLAFDFNGDGTTDKTVAGCATAMQCQ